MFTPEVFNLEILSPKQDVDDLEAALENFSVKYRKAFAAGYVICIPDNPLGHLAFQGVELITELDLPVNSEQISIHINTFHTRQDLDWILNRVAELGIGDVLAVSGDGSQRLPKLHASDLGLQVDSVTSVELVQYIHQRFPGVFRVGVAYNPYEPQQHEWEKLERKLAAGAEYVTTQPIIGGHPSVEHLLNLGVPVVVEAWMSKKIHLLSDCVGYDISPDSEYDPMENLRTLMANYPQCRFYLSILGFKTQFPKLPELLQAVSVQV